MKDSENMWQPKETQKIREPDWDSVTLVVISASFILHFSLLEPVIDSWNFDLASPFAKTKLNRVFAASRGHWTLAQHAMLSNTKTAWGTFWLNPLSHHSTTITLLRWPLFLTRRERPEEGFGSSVQMSQKSSRLKTHSKTNWSSTREPIKKRLTFVDCSLLMWV